ncbi:hypothetical protein D3C75_1326210 [compost metagenome]
MACWHRHHQRVIPHGFGGYTFTYFIRLREAHVVQVVLQSLDLLRQGHLKQPDIDFWFLLSAKCEQGR